MRARVPNHLPPFYILTSSVTFVYKMEGRGGASYARLGGQETNRREGDGPFFIGQGREALEGSKWLSA